MEFKTIVGIDVSKLTIDAAVHGQKDTEEFANSKKGFRKLFSWIRKLTKEPLDQALFCFEHTGLYSVALSVHLSESGFSFAQVSALEIKRSMGIARGKNDRVDALRIARYAYERREDIQLSTLPDASLTKLQLYLTLRSTLVRQRSSLNTTAKEQQAVYSSKEYKELFRVYAKASASLQKQIEEIERKMSAIIEADEKLKQNYKLVTSVTGIGQFTASYILVCTQNFQRFENWRKFACYSGTAPFEYSSGTSVRGRTKVHHFANREIKSLLFMCALSAVKFDGELRRYYQRRTEEGKSKMSTLNIIKNKLLARIFAAVKRQSPYVKLDML